MPVEGFGYDSQSQGLEGTTVPGALIQGDGVNFYTIQTHWPRSRAKGWSLDIWS